VSRRSEVLVVGAGLSGLTAAYRLHGAGIDVGVVEARGRVGGRAWRVAVGDAEFDAGCEALDHEHVALRTLADELGVAIWEAPPWSSDPPGGLEGADADLFAELDQEVNELAARVDPDHPEDVAGAGALDTQTLAGWLEDRQASPRVVDAVEEWIAVASSTVPTKRMSLLAYAVKLAAGAAPTGLTLRFEGGPSALATSLEGALDGRVRLDASIAGVEDEGDEVVVRFRDGASERAGRVVVAVPLTLQSELQFRPELPEHRRRALAEAIYGTVVKEGALFAGARAVPSPDLSRDGHFYRSAHEPRLLVRFAGAGAAGREVSLGSLVGEEPEAQVAVDWVREEWTRGSYLILGPGQLLDWGGRLGEPHGRVHFAGVERAALKSYMEGAARAGDEVAAEILAARAD
jgi:monoamine oxidase